MEKQKLAELVMQKMKEKKELEERNRPHFEVLRLEATFQKEIHDDLKTEISELEELLNLEKNTLKELTAHLQQLDNTGKRHYPRIIIMPDFIASQHIQPTIKEFYRKASNSFLRTDIIRNKEYTSSVSREKEFLEKIAEVDKLENELEIKKESDRKILNSKRTKVLKEDLRLRALRDEQKQIKETIEREKEENKDLIKQYEVKKLNLQNRRDHLAYVKEQIESYKQKIQQAFNPHSYRQHLQNIFNREIKNQTLTKNLYQISKKVQGLEKETENFERKLEKTISLTVLGRTKDSPSTKKGKIQKRLQAEKDSQLMNTHRRSTSVMSSRAKSQPKARALSQLSVKQSALDLDLSKIDSTAKNSLKTTDRSSHPRYRSELAKQLF